MTEWVDFLVYATLIAIVWFALPIMNARFALPLIADRNADWLASHRESASRWTGSSAAFAFCYVLGTLSIAALLSFQAGWWWPEALLPPPELARWEMLSRITTTSVLAAVAYYIFGGVLFVLWLNKEVPLAAHRQATLERRSLDDFIAPGFRMAAYSLIAVLWAGWLTVGVLGLYTIPDFWTRAVGQVVFPIIFMLFTRYAVNRRPNAMDRIFGRANRRAEVRLGFGMLLYVVAWSTLQLYDAVVEDAAFDVQRALHVAVASIVVLIFLSFALGMKPREDVANQSAAA